MINISLYIILTVLIYFSGFSKAEIAVNQSDLTEIIVIGTVHESTSNFNSDTLLMLLKKIKPDVILVETDTSYFENDFSFKEEIKYMSPETSAISDYIIDYRVILRPYDINGRDIFLDDWKRLDNQDGFFKDIQDLYINGIYNETSGEIYSRINKMIETADELSNSTLSYINSKESSTKIDTINYYTYTGLGRLIDETPELSGYSDYWDKESDFWNKRNDAMVTNILGISKEYNGKKILVLCGFAHKNILLTELLNQSEEYRLIVKTLNDL